MPKMEGRTKEHIFSYQRSISIKSSTSTKLTNTDSNSEVHSETINHHPTTYAQPPKIDHRKFTSQQLQFSETSSSCRTCHRNLFGKQHPPQSDPDQRPQLCNSTHENQTRPTQPTQATKLSFDRPLDSTTEIKPSRSIQISLYRPNKPKATQEHHLLTRPLPYVRPNHHSPETPKHRAQSQLSKKPSNANNTKFGICFTGSTLWIRKWSI
jgi:hypothetical protein